MFHWELPPPPTQPLTREQLQDALQRIVTKMDDILAGGGFDIEGTCGECGERERWTVDFVGAREVRTYVEALRLALEMTPAVAGLETD